MKATARAAATALPLLQHMLHARAFPDPGASEFSETVTVQTLADSLAPKPVTDLVATSVDGGVRLDMTLPTLNTDDSALTDLKWLEIYYDPTDAINVDAPATYTGIFVVAATSQWTDRSGTVGDTRYYRVVAKDDAGNRSDASSEVHAAPATPSIEDIPTDASGLVFDGNPKVGDGMLGLLFEDPVWGAFLEWEVQYTISTDSGSSFGAWQPLVKTPKHCYIHKGLTTTSTYRYKYRARPTGKDQASTTWDESDNGGTGWPSGGSWQTDNSNLVTELVMAEVMVASDEIRTDHLQAEAVTGAKILADEIISDHIKTNAVTTIKINGLAVTQTKIGNDEVVYGKIYDNAVRTAELYVDNTVIFDPGGGYNSINGCDYMEEGGATKSLDLANGIWYGKAANYVNLQSGGSDNIVYIRAGESGAELQLSSITDISLLATDDIVFQVGSTSDWVHFNNCFWTTSSKSIQGYMGVKIDGTIYYFAARQ